ncbi:17455_t:CDS:2 [Dentiscutata heterogama]|uniref:17455_t:CDS:1 n=1 Tax=Dentiscutata heterogama TaxID=1316150 RepID=A0ACA9L8T6_9GLOM|nr:17455_t:CDS:2 [Dentiscutata heterogama]
MEITHLSLSPDDTYDADMIDRRIFIVIPLTKKIMDISHHPNDERLYNELNGHFFVITDPSVQEIIDGDYEFFVGSNDFIPERHCIHSRIRQTFLWYLTWSGGNNDN